MTKETITATVENEEQSLVVTQDIIRPQPVAQKDEGAAQAEKSNKIVIHGNDFYADTGKFEHLWRVATAFSRSTMLPNGYSKSPENCLLAIDMAMQVVMNPLQFMQATNVINGKLGFSGQYVIALINNKQRFQSDINFEYSGDVTTQDFSCTAWAMDKSGVRKEFTISVREATKVGKASSNPNWSAIPRLMITYRAAAYFARVHCPEILLGMQTIEELQDMNPNVNPIKDVSTQRIDELNSKYFSTPREDIVNVDK
jgi:hypothetical protein